MSQTTGQHKNQGQKPKREKNAFKDTLNLPKTDFPMRAGLINNEPKSIGRWDGMALYQKLRDRQSPKGRWVFHDGPPYANGSIHLGHLLNKCLKDFVVRSRSMEGYDVPFVPGWDCHGLPIEHKVMADLVKSGAIKKLEGLDDDARRLAVREACAEHATTYWELQTGQMKRLLTLADYDDPYLTMHPRYESAVLEVLGELCKQGLVYRALKPVHWSIANETALAEAELEYEEREDLSVYVDFESADAEAVFEAFGLGDSDQEQLDLGAQPTFMIWTTTPWTLPANMAIAVNERFTYALVRLDGNVSVLAEDLVEKVAKLAEAESVEVLATTKGSSLVGLAYRHAFRDAKPEVGGDANKIWTIVPAEYVTLEDGTGLVHTATGHGGDDFNTGLKENIGVYCPVLADGRYDETVPEWLIGKSVWAANKLVTEHLRESGHLFYSHTFMHSYPHDWRSKTPVIFRATSQWFIGVDRTYSDGGSLRERGLAATHEGVRFVPEWGRNRLRGMLENRPDWCISRQRAWGLPIPAFFDGDGNALLTPASVEHIAELVGKKGSDAWFTMTAGELLEGYDLKADPDAPAGFDVAGARKGADILDVWFESGCSWHATMRTRSEGADFPIELYLEGSDQHRGWFQVSMLTALGVTGRPPYETLLTHGFMVGKDGHKLSKSKGNAIENLFDKYGGDVLRWWVSSLSYEGDMKVDEAFFSEAGESYRKVRNTIRFLLSNLDGFDPSAHMVSEFEPTSPEAWVLAQLATLERDVRAAYEGYHFQRAHKALHAFCNDTLSAVYLSAIKDRMYCDRVDSPRRRRAQSALFRVADSLCRLLAPILCHTADEAFAVLHGESATCVHLELFSDRNAVQADAEWAVVMELRDRALLALEHAKQRGIENPLEAGLVLPDPDGVLARFERNDLADLHGVSRVEFGDELAVNDLREAPRCERSWKRTADVAKRSNGALLCDRDADALGLI